MGRAVRYTQLAFVALSGSVCNDREPKLEQADWLLLIVSRSHFTT